jgi:hypothetical protein
VVRLASGAEIDGSDMARCKPRAIELILCHRNQVKMRGGFWLGTVPGRLHIEEREGVALGTGRRVPRRLAKELIRVWEALPKGLFHIFSHLVATRADGRT